MRVIEHVCFNTYLILDSFLVLVLCWGLLGLLITYYSYLAVLRCIRSVKNDGYNAIGFGIFGPLILSSFYLLNSSSCSSRWQFGAMREWWSMATWSRNTWCRIPSPMTRSRCDSVLLHVHSAENHSASFGSLMFIVYDLNIYLHLNSRI